MPTGWYHSGRHGSSADGIGRPRRDRRKQAAARRRARRAR